MSLAETKPGVAVLGTGFLGSLRAAACRAVKDCRLVAVADAQIDRARPVADRFSVAAEAGLEAILARDDVHAVIVATPHADHAEQVAACLGAGKHVLCEKPLTTSAADARRLAGLAATRGLVLATGFNHRHYPPVRDALAVVASGELGRVEKVRISIGHRAGADFLAGWHTDVGRSGGGTLMDNGPHAIDLARLFLGEINEVEGTTEDTIGLPDGCESAAVALLHGRDGGSAEVRSSWTQETGYLTIEVEGDSGRLRVETAPWSLTVEKRGVGRSRRSYFVERVREAFFRRRLGCERSLVGDLAAFVDRVRGGTSPIASAWDGCRATEIVEAIYASARDGRPRRLDPLPVSLPGSRRPAGSLRR